MARISLLIGASAVAFAAAAINAQTTINGDSGTAVNGNRTVVSCTVDSGNECSVDQGAAGETVSALAFVNVDGLGNSSTVDQQGGQLLADNRTHGNSNRAFTIQRGFNLSSIITQSIASSATSSNAGALAQNNIAEVLQTNSAGADSSITQSHGGNTALVAMFGGNNTPNNASSPVTGANISSVVQGNTEFQAGAAPGNFIAAAPTAANNPDTGNLADVAITGYQNNSTVLQNGVQNTVEQSMLNGGTGNTGSTMVVGVNPASGAASPENRPEGNSSTINQIGRGNYAATSIGGRVTIGGGVGNLTLINQTQSDAATTSTTLNSVQTNTAAHRALVYQRGIFDQVSIDQSNNSIGGDASGTTIQSGSVADVSQLSFNSVTSITQVGSNTVRVTQGARQELNGGDNVIDIGQTDAGDTGVLGGSRNFVEIAQSGIQNLGIVRQDAINANVTIFQAVGTRNNRSAVVQGGGFYFDGQSAQQSEASNVAANTASNSRDLIAQIDQTAGAGGEAVIVQAGRNLSAFASQAGGTASVGSSAIAASQNVIALSQAYAFNKATVAQNGSNLTANVEQRGTGSASLQNLVTITQSNVNNTALARQTQNVGASSLTDATAGAPGDLNFPQSRSGANSAEIAIMQSGTGGSATVEQRGKGQYASLAQSGVGNTGGILQDEDATNAVAVLSQSGTGNTYYITQSTAGQYIKVSQSGSGNNLTTSVVNGLGGSGNNSSTPQTAPVFGGTP